MKTIREIANELGVDKQKVYRFIKQNHINEAHHEALQRSGVKYYDEAAETLIKQGFSDETASSEAHQNRINEAVFDAVIEMLQKELEIKNEQIKELNGWNDYLRYINFNGYDYTRKDGWSFSVSK